VSSTEAAEPNQKVPPELVTITIQVNEQPVRLEGRRHTGLEIKQAAIAQGVRIQLDFVLLEELPHHRTKEIKDSESVELTDHSRFQAIPNDDQS
jgi:hypothetical protein